MNLFHLHKLANIVLTLLLLGLPFLSQPVEPTPTTEDGNIHIVDSHAMLPVTQPRLHKPPVIPNPASQPPKSARPTRQENPALLDEGDPSDLVFNQPSGWEATAFLSTLPDSAGSSNISAGQSAYLSYSILNQGGDMPADSPIEICVLLPIPGRSSARHPCTAV